MLKIEMINIPNNDFDEFEEEPTDELASAGFRIVDVEGKDDVEKDDDEKLEEEGIVEVELDEEEKDEEEKPEILDGLKELEEMEKSYVAPPLTFADEE